jgi:hypothetical protein
MKRDEFNNFQHTFQDDGSNVTSLDDTSDEYVGYFDVKNIPPRTTPHGCLAFIILTPSDST